MQRLFDCITEYDTITLFRHIGADADALGAQFGLKQWINENYPQKRVYALGASVGSIAVHYPSIDEADDEAIQSSLAIILDTANASRIDDTRCLGAAFKIKIDHHIFVDAYADIEYIEDKKGATCEILANMFQQRGETLSKQCAEYLYSGLIADTLQFSINATTPQMLRTAAYLVEQGVDVAKVNEMNFSKSLKEYRYETYIREHVQLFHEHIAFCKITKAEYEQFDLTYNEAKEKTYALSHVNEFHAWILFVESTDSSNEMPLYNASIRSRNVIINDIAMNFNGGGHRYACGAKNLTEAQITELLEQLSQRINNKG